MPLLAHCRPPTVLPESPEPSHPPLCSAQPVAQMRWGGVQPPALLCTLLTWGGQVGASRMVLRQEPGHSLQACWRPDSRDEPSVARVRGPPLSAAAAGPRDNELHIELLL